MYLYLCVSILITYRIICVCIYIDISMESMLFYFRLCATNEAKRHGDVCVCLSRESVHIEMVVCVAVAVVVSFDFMSLTR